MKPGTSHDVQGRTLCAAFRAAVIGEALGAFAMAEHDGFSKVSADALHGLGDIADDLTAELKAIDVEGTRQEDLLYTIIAEVCGEQASQTVLRRMTKALQDGAHVAIGGEA